MKNNASLLYSFFLIIGDFLALVAAFTAAYILRVTYGATPFIQISALDYLRVFLYLLPFWLVIFGLLGLYNKNIYESRFSEFGRLLIGCFIGILLVVGYSYITDTIVFPARLVTVYGLLLALCFTLLFRTIARAIKRGLFSYGVGVNNVLIVGNTSVTDELIGVIRNTRLTGYRIAGLVTTKTKPHKSIPESRIYRTFAKAMEELKSQPVHSIIQTELYADAERNSEILTYAQKHHIAYRFVPGNGELFVGNIEVDLFHSIPVIAVHQTALVGWGRIVKRLFDFFVSLVAIIVFSPIMFIIWLCLMLGGGTPIYRRERLTRFGNSFTIYKFRSLKKKYNGMDPEEGFTKMGRPDLIKKFRANGDFLEKDPRIGGFGRFIRKTSLDELPQLFNVLKGDVSLVGPRALIAKELDQYEHKDLILSVKSGLTGLAIISGRKAIPFEERRKLDLYYVQNWSFWGDIVIMLKTVSVLLFHRGAE